MSMYQLSEGSFAREGNIARVNADFIAAIVYDYRSSNKRFLLDGRYDTEKGVFTGRFFVPSEFEAVGAETRAHIMDWKLPFRLMEQQSPVHVLTDILTGGKMAQYATPDEMADWIVLNRIHVVDAFGHFSRYMRLGTEFELDSKIEFVGFAEELGGRRRKMKITFTEGKDGVEEFNGGIDYIFPISRRSTQAL